MVICDYYLRGICRFGNDCWNEHPTKKIDLNNNIDSINKESISKIKPIFSDDKLRVLKTDMKELKNDLRSLFRAFSFSNNSDQEQKNSKSPTIFGSKNNLQIPTSNIPSIKFTIGTSNKKPCEEGKEKHNNRSRYNIYFSREKLIPEVKKLPLSHIETESFEGNLFETNEIKEINMKELISAINKLQDVFNTLNLPNSIQLPQIVMLGSQSTGKSSVLESIVRRPFLPRGSGIVTRCPLVLQLIECPLDDRKYRRENNGTIDVKEWGVFLHAKDRIFTDFDEIRKEIEDQTDLIAGSNKGICAEPINLKIFSPEVVNLTLVDLPGITKVPVGDQPEDIEDQIKSLVMEYIKNPNSIILSVSAANVDLATSESLKYAKEVDPDGKRTLAVLTKIDLMDAGTDANEMLTGAVIPVKLGIVGVINRSQLDINNNKTIAEQLEDEKEYFAKNYKKIASHNGIPHLEQRLSKLLMNHIYECLPNLKKEVQMKRVEWQNIFDQCGEELTNPDKIFMKIITSITNDFRGSIDGTTLKVERNAKKVFGGPAMRKVFDEIFAKEIEKIEPQISKQDIIVYINHSGGPRPDVFAPEKLFEKLIKENIERLQAPSLDCLQHIHNEIDKVIKMILKNNFELNRFPKLAGRIKYMLIEFLNERLPETESYLKYLIKAELASINKNHPEFSIEEALKSLSMEEENKEDGLIQDGKAFSFASAHTKVNSSFAFDKTKVESKTQTRAKVQQDKIKRHAEVIESLVNNYFPIVKKTVQDLTPKIIMHSMVNDMCDSIDSKLLVLYKDIDELLNESKDNTDKRNEAKDMLKALKIADSTINQVYESEV